MHSYSDLLLTDEWRKKRNEIVSRDKFKCSNCNNLQLIEGTDSELLLVENYMPRSSLLIFGDSIPDFKRGSVHKISGLDKLMIDKTFMIHYAKRDNGNYIQVVRSLTEHEKSKYIIERNKFTDTQIRDLFNKYLVHAPRVIAEMYNRVSVYFNYCCEKVNIDANTLKCIEWYFVKGLNVHHTYYQNGLRPWEYPDQSLITYCQPCHEELHSRIRIPRLDAYGNELGQLTTCYRCAGSGWFPEYKHIAEGICFRCNGAKYEELIN